MGRLVHDTAPLVLDYAVQEQIRGREFAQPRHDLRFEAAEYPAGQQLNGAACEQRQSTEHDVGDQGRRAHYGFVPMVRQRGRTLPLRKGAEHDRESVHVGGDLVGDSCLHGIDSERQQAACETVLAENHGHGEQ